MVRSDHVFLDSENQFLSEIHLPSGLDADANVSDGFTDDAARHGDTALTDCNEQNHRFTEPGRIYGRIIFSFLSDHVVTLPTFG
jgi:hypothetical protein